MYLCPTLRRTAYGCAIIAFVVFGCHFLVGPQTTSTNHPGLLTTDLWTFDNDVNVHVRGKRDVLDYSEPRVNTMCSEAKDVFLLVLINSAPQNFYLRWTIRQTWGNLREYKGFNIRLVFVVGQLSGLDQRTDHLVRKESAKMNDMVIGDFHDTYYNLTAKTLFGMNWVRKYCSNSQFVVKGDDDVLVVPQNIIEYILELPPTEAEFLYEGACQVNHEPMRNKENKWFISESEYPNATYPTYQLGVAVLHSYKALDIIYQACYNVPSRMDVPLNFPFDDVFIGICAQLTEVQPTCNNHIIVYKDREMRLFMRSRRQNCHLATTLAVHGLNSRHSVKRRWRLLENIDRKTFANCTFNHTTTAT